MSFPFDCNRCSRCGKEIGTGGCVSCAAQRVLCALCGVDLSPPDYAHGCPNMFVAGMVVELGNSDREAVPIVSPEDRRE